MKQLDLQQIFNRELAVPNVNRFEELAAILKDVQAFDSPAEINSCLNDLRDINGGSEQVGVGVKKVLLAVGEARQDDNPPARFAEVISQQIAASRD
jgi:vesicle-fusing ATPase